MKHQTNETNRVKRLFKQEEERTNVYGKEKNKKKKKRKQF